MRRQHVAIQASVARMKRAQRWRIGWRRDALAALIVAAFVGWFYLLCRLGAWLVSGGRAF